VRAAKNCKTGKHETINLEERKWREPIPGKRALDGRITIIGGGGGGQMVGKRKTAPSAEKDHEREELWGG